MRHLLGLIVGSAFVLAGFALGGIARDHWYASHRAEFCDPSSQAGKEAPKLTLPNGDTLVFTGTTGTVYTAPPPKKSGYEWKREDYISRLFHSSDGKQVAAVTMIGKDSWDCSMGQRFLDTYLLREQAEGACLKAIESPKKAADPTRELSEIEIERKGILDSKEAMWKSRMEMDAQERKAQEAANAETAKFCPNTYNADERGTYFCPPPTKTPQDPAKCEKAERDKQLTWNTLGTAVLPLPPEQVQEFAVYDSELNLIVSISAKDGSVTYGKNFTHDEAAKEFWKRVSLEYLTCKGH